MNKRVIPIILFAILTMLTSSFGIFALNENTIGEETELKIEANVNDEESNTIEEVDNAIQEERINYEDNDITIHEEYDDKMLEENNTVNDKEMIYSMIHKKISNSNFSKGYMDSILSIS